MCVGLIAPFPKMTDTPDETRRDDDGLPAAPGSFLDVKLVIGKAVAPITPSTYWFWLPV